MLGFSPIASTPIADDYVRLQSASASTAAGLTVGARPTAIYSGSATFALLLAADAACERISFYGAKADIRVFMNASARLKWEPEPDTPETWTDVLSASGIWTDVPDTSETWTEVA